MKLKSEIEVGFKFYTLTEECQHTVGHVLATISSHQIYTDVEYTFKAETYSTSIIHVYWRLQIYQIYTDVKYTLRAEYKHIGGAGEIHRCLKCRESLQIIAMYHV